jgi:hypothetical protein
LGHGYSRDPERTPEARAESRRRAMRDELTGTLARAGFTPGEAELGGTVPETIGPTMTRQSAEARRQRIAGFVNAIPTQPGHAGHTALLAEVDPSGLRGELHPAEPRDYETPAERRSRELELENVRFGHEKVIAGIRAAPDPEEEARANLAERDQIIQEQTAATFAAKDRYGVDLGRPSLRTRADTTAFTADTSRINQMTRDLDVLRNQAPGAVQRPKTREQAQARAHQLQRQGKSRAQILQIMTREGYSVR